MPDRPAPLGDHGPDLDAAGQHHPDRAGVGDLVVDHEPVAARLHGRRGQPADDLELRQVLVDPVEEGVGREGERVGEQQHRAVGMVGPADQRRPVGGRHHLEADGRQQRRRQPGGEEGEGGGVLHLAAAADDRPGGAAEQDRRVEEAPDGRGDVLEGADVVGGGEGDHEIGPLVAQALEHLADGLADGLASGRVLRQPEGVTHSRRRAYRDAWSALLVVGPVHRLDVPGLERALLGPPLALAGAHGGLGGELVAGLHAPGLAEAESARSTGMASISSSVCGW